MKLYTSKRVFKGLKNSFSNNQSSNLSSHGKVFEEFFGNWQTFLYTSKKKLNVIMITFVWFFFFENQ